ncbi:VOC family protein [Bacillus sp. B15-48]|uniref:VOC family protein n=1 Tax=Bacillus sp. B15-48 TaxID=1548601 RepID=UPI00193EC3CC|nr:VOC family protein [Bacillus sp. B15-48]MBM4764988.1 catechol 2,3-dioxygenase [Bacillus sp. B15-48]
MKNEYLISQLAHVELISPKLEETVKFMKEMIGLEVTERVGQSVYMRAWNDYFHHSLKITEGEQAGLGHIGFRATGPEGLERAVKIIESTGLGEGWIDGEQGHGAAYRFKTPGGHTAEVFWDVEWYQAPEEMRSKWKNRAQKIVRRGVGAKRIDHVTCASPDTPADREFFQYIGFRFHEGIYTSVTERELGAWLAVSNLSHEIAFLNPDPNIPRGTMHHLAYAVDSREEILMAADTLIDYGYKLEGGPDRHALAEGFYLYVREPGGNLIELYALSHLIFAPDWGPFKWKIEENPNSAWSDANIMIPLDDKHVKTK